MVTPSPDAPRARMFDPARIARDFAFVMPGFFISLFAFVLLVPLFTLSIGTLIIWVGALLLPITLIIASGFAELSRARVRRWGLPLPPAAYVVRGPGFAGWLRQASDPRRWLDLAFEGLVALPLRLFTFCVAVTWSAGALGGITFWIWAVYLPQDSESLAGLILEAISGGTAPDSLTHSYTLEALFNLGWGILLLITLPPVLRGFARLDATTTAAALRGPDVGNPAVAASADASAGAAGASAAVPLTGASGARPSAGSPPARLPNLGASASLTAEGWAWVAAVFAAVATLAVSWPVLAALYGMHPAIAMLVAAAHTTALLLVIRTPVVGILVQTIAVAVTALLTAGSLDFPWPWPVAAMIVQAVLVLLVALRRPWPWALAVWLPPQLAALVVVLFGFGAGSGTAAGDSAGAGSTVSNLIVASSVTLGVAAIGVFLRVLMTSRGALRAERRANADLSAERRELDERTRIAQELHDVVAHSMSVISVQATTAEYRMPDLESDTRQEFASIAQSSRQALSEMRSLLALLRSSEGDGEAPLAPQPGLDDISALVENTRQSGAEISFVADGSESPGTASAPAHALAGLAAYRIVQEALSNAVRHAPGAGIVVSVRADSTAVSVEVRNGPPSVTRDVVPAPGAGLGLAGARERAQALGGSFSAAPTDDAGFVVAAVLPIA